MSRPKRVTFMVEFDLPLGCGVGHALEVVRDHLSCIGGDRRPPGADPEFPESDPMFNIDRSSIQVTKIRGL